MAQSAAWCRLLGKQAGARALQGRLSRYTEKRFEQRTLIIGNHLLAALRCISQV